MAVKNYLKVFADGHTEATVEKPSFGEVSASGDYYINGLWHDKLGVVYPIQFTYMAKDDKLATFLIEGGQPVDVTYEYDSPSIVQNVIQAKKVVQTENRKIIELGTIFTANRYVVDNPFGNENYEDCDVKVELFINGIWSGQDFVYADGGYGASSFSNLEGLVVQTGSIGLVGPYADINGNGHGSPGSDITSAPARVIVTHQGKAK